MKKFSIIILLSIVCSGFLVAQNTINDSLAIISIKWEQEKIRKGVVWKSAQTTLYNSPQSINIIEIKPKRKNRLGIGYCVDTLITTSSLCNQINAIAGVNASFFDMQNGGSVDYMRVNGNVIHEGRINFDNSNAAIVINNNKLAIIKQNNDSLWAHKLDGNDVLVAGPMLVSNGKIENFPETSFYLTRHPRTCAAICQNGTILLVTVDGRHDAKAEGMSTNELAYFLKILNAKQAMNFDGGGSTTMFIKNKGHNGVINFPSDNQRFDNEGERKVANVVYLK